MNRLITLVGSTVVTGLMAWSLPAAAQSEGPRTAKGGTAVRYARAGATGSIEGRVTDEMGIPLPGVTVSASGATTALAVTDKQGSYALRLLPVGGYLVRASLAGFVPSRRQFLQVTSTNGTRFSFSLQHTGRTDGDTLAAGFVPVGSARPVKEGSEASDDHSETAWRLLHLKRSVLKESTERVSLGEVSFDEGRPGTLAVLARAMGSSARFLSELPISGQVNFLTTGTLDGATTVDPEQGPFRGVAYLSLGGPVLHGEWAAQALTEGDLGSWFFSTSYRRRAPASHQYSLGASFSTQRFSSGPRWPLAPGSDGARSAGSFYANDDWTLSPKIMVSLGAGYSRYDYLADRGLFSPRATLTVIPVAGLRVHGSVSRRVLAPGAEEFLEPLATGLWVPAERTFSGLGRLEAEHTDHFELGVRQDLFRTVAVGFRAFFQATTHQQVALFGLGNLVPTGQYGVASAGDLSATGWSVELSGSPVPRLRGSIAYGVSATQWLPSTADALLLVNIARRPEDQRIHDFTSAIEAEMPITATRVYVTYKLNSGFVRPGENGLTSHRASRFDLQIMQRLPFLDFTTARWQALFAVRNLFRDAVPDGSIYDELLVVRPPKRVVTGLLVRF